MLRAGYCSTSTCCPRLWHHGRVLARFGWQRILLICYFRARPVASHRIASQPVRRRGARHTPSPASATGGTESAEADADDVDLLADAMLQLQEDDDMNDMNDLLAAAVNNLPV